MPACDRRELCDAVFGTQDPLVSTLGTLTGIAAGSQSSPLVILSGLVIVAAEWLAITRYRGAPHAAVS
jgi:hypothetical protein